MADEPKGTDATTTDVDSTHGSDAFVDTMTDRFERLDREAEGEDAGEDDDKGDAGAKAKKGKGDSADETEGEDEDADADESADGSAEHTDEDTSDDGSDGSESESDEDSGAGDEAEHADDESDSANDDDADGDDTADNEADDANTGDEGDDADEDASAETKATLEAAGADTKLEDVPKQYRPLIEKKLRGIDSAFTRIQQEFAEFRKEKVRFRADEQFRKENPDAVVVELLRADPDLLDRVNTKLDELADGGKAKEYDDDVKKKRTKAVEKVNDELTAIDKRIERGEAVADLASSEAQRLGLPWKYAERVIETEILRRVNAGKAGDVTDDEVKTLVAAEAKEYRIHTRGKRRDESKEAIKHRTIARKTTGSPVKRPPVGTKSPGPTRPKSKEIDYNNEDERLASLERAAEKIMPGRK